MVVFASVVPTRVPALLALLETGASALRMSALASVPTPFGLATTALARLVSRAP